MEKNDLTISINEFNGPLDLLLHLIRTQELDIFDLPIVQVTEQFLNYLKNNLDPNLDSASEYLYMAANLIKIKSRYLLPMPEDEENNEVDPREELVQSLIDYQRFNAVLPEFQELQEQRGKSFLRSPAEIPEEVSISPLMSGVLISDLQKSFIKIVKRQLGGEKQTRSIIQETYSVTDKMFEIRNMLIGGSKRKEIPFKELFLNSHNADEMITIFLAVLELAKENDISIQKKDLYDFYITNMPTEEKEVSNE